MANTAHHNDYLVLVNMTPLLAYRTDRRDNPRRLVATSALPDEATQTIKSPAIWMIGI